MNHRNMKRSYPNSASAKSAKTSREFLSQLMVSTHGITAALADYHVSAMTDREVLDQIERRSGTELSAAAPTNAGEVFPTGVLISRDDDGTAALNCAPIRDYERGRYFLFGRRRKKGGGLANT